jgi:hypothetical protein
MANYEEQMEMQKLYAQFWEPYEGEDLTDLAKPQRVCVEPTKAEAIGDSLQHLAATFRTTLTQAEIKSFLATLLPMASLEIIQAFARVTVECRFFPNPATLREFSGRPVSGDPIAAEAKEELLKLICGMRTAHGPMLRPTLG